MGVSATRAFDFYADALNLEPMTPPRLHFRLLTLHPITIQAGALTELPSAPTRRPNPLADADRDLGTTLPFLRHHVEGPYSLWEHTHAFEPDGEEPCAMYDRVPYGPLSELAQRLFVRRDLERIFGFRRDAFATQFG